MATMILLSWNCQGLGQSLIVQALRELKYKFCSLIIFTIKSKNSSIFCKRIRSLGFECIYFVESEVLSGGLCLWQKNSIHIKVLSSARIKLLTHYSEAKHRTLKVVVFYGLNICHIPHNIRLKDFNLPFQSGNKHGQNI